MSLFYHIGIGKYCMGIGKVSVLALICHYRVTYWQICLTSDQTQGKGLTPWQLSKMLGHVEFALEFPKCTFERGVCHSQLVTSYKRYFFFCMLLYIFFSGIGIWYRYRLTQKLWYRDRIGNEKVASGHH